MQVNDTGISSDDEDFLAQVEEVESRIKEGGKVIDDEGDDDSVESADDVFVPPRGYNLPFWDGFLDDELGGSNDVDIMYPSNSTIDKRFASTIPERKKGQFGGRPDPNQKNREYAQHSNDTAPSHNSNSTGAGGSSGSVRDQTNATGRDPPKLADIDDEEFDIPPLFDDTLYKSIKIPDLDVDADGEELYVGKVYGNKVDCQIALAIYAIKQQFHFNQSNTKKHSFVLSCVDNKCDWRVLAGEKKNNCNYQLRKLHLNHTCSIDSKDGYKKRVTSRIIASVYKSKFGDTSNCPKPLDLQQLVLEDLGVSPSYMQCWRAKEKAIVDTRGAEENSYLKLPSYLRRLKLANPGTITALEIEKDEDDMDRFLYCFLAFGASIQGFKKMRRVIILDGTHLTGKFKGVLLTASGQDSNYQVYPLAFGVVDSENDNAWTWFLSNLERIIADSHSLTLISDRHPCILKAVSTVYLKSHHGACLVHLQRNINSKFKKPGLAELVGRAACSYRVGIFRKLYNEVWAADRTCAQWLEKIGPATWSRAYFPGNRYNLMTSHIAETLNNALYMGRGCPITELLMFIRSMMSRWFNARRRKSGWCTASVPPEVDLQMAETMKHVKASKVTSNSDWVVEVVGRFNDRN